MHIATITSRVVTKHQGEIAIEEGFFELQVQVSMKEARISGDPKGFIDRAISNHVTQCRIATGLPLFEGLWQVAFSQWAQINLNYPEGFVI